MENKFYEYLTNEHNARGIGEDIWADFIDLMDHIVIENPEFKKDAEEIDKDLYKWGEIFEKIIKIYLSPCPQEEIY